MLLNNARAAHAKSNTPARISPTHDVLYTENQRGEQGARGLLNRQPEPTMLGVKEAIVAGVGGRHEAERG